MENNIFSLNACVITITHNFNIPGNLKEKIYNRFISIMKQYRCMVQYNQKHEDDIYLDGTKDKIFMIRFEYNSGISPNYSGLTWSNNIKDIIQIDLSVPLERFIVVCSQLEPDRIDFFVDTDNIKKQIKEKNELIELNKKKKQISNFKLKNMF